MATSTARLARLLCLAAVLGGVLAGGWALYAGWIVVPARFNPWADLDLDEAPNLLTRTKLERAQRDPEKCSALLGSAGVQFQPVPDRITGEGCALQTAVQLRRLDGLALSSPVLLSCRAVLSLALWERHVLQPAALEHLGTRISRVEHLGGYACRNIVTGRPPPDGAPARRSRHATADALDVAAFVRADGAGIISIRRDWPHSAGEARTDANARFLKEIHRGGCGLFDSVLGPDFNAVHVDHFHLEVGGWRSCR